MTTRFVLALPWWLWLPGAVLYAMFWICVMFVLALWFLLLALYKLITFIVTEFRKNLHD